MKKLYALTFATLALSLAVSCSDDEPKGPAYTLRTATFESARLTDGTNLVSGEETLYQEEELVLKNREYYTMVGGAVVSSLSDVSDWESDYPGTPTANAVITADASLPGGANGSDNFVVFSYSSTVGDAYKPEFSFAEGAEYEIRSILVNNTAQDWQVFKIGYYSYPGFSAGDYCEIVFTGYDAAGTETGSTRFALADFRDGEEFICAEWTEVSLAALGKVNKVVMTRETTETLTNIYSRNTDYQVCVDEIAYLVPDERK